MSTEPDWVLQIPFITAPGFTLSEQRAVGFAGFNGVVKPGPLGYALLVVDGLESEAAARRLFEPVRVGLLVATLNVSWGLRVRDEIVALREGCPLPAQVDVPVIYQEGHDLSRLLIGHPLIQTQIGKVWPKFLASLEFGIASEPAATALSNDRVKLAFELYEDSYFENSQSARFLGLIGTLEVLKDKDRTSKAAQELVRRWHQEAKTLDKEEAASIQGSLDRLKSLSIARGIASVVSRHLGPERGNEAKALYAMRSDLVHEGRRPADLDAVVRRATQIVMDLLGRILVTGSL